MNRKRDRKTFKKQVVELKRMIAMFEDKLNEIISNQEILALALGVDLNQKKQELIMALFGSDNQELQEAAQEIKDLLFPSLEQQIARMKAFEKI